MGAFLIPISMSSLRGLSHILTCRDEAATPFTLAIPPPELGPPQLLSSTRIQRGAEKGFCGGLFTKMGAQVTGQHKITMIVGITNRSDYDWQGTIELHLGSTAIPVGIGNVPAGATEEDTVEFDLDPGTHEVEGSLLIGP